MIRIYCKNQRNLLLPFITAPKLVNKEKTLLHVHIYSLE